MAHFRVYGYKGPFVPVRYYAGDTACRSFYGPGNSPRIYGGTNNSPLQTVAWTWAWYVYNNYSSRGVPVNVAAHSQGGLIVRYAIDAVQKRKSGWPPFIVAPTIVTFGSAHNGVEGAVIGCRLPWFHNAKQCRQQDKSAPFIEYLRDNARKPQGAYGTFWALAGSHQDDSVDENSALAMPVVAKRRWAGDASIEHGDYMHEKLGVSPFDLDPESPSRNSHCWSTYWPWPDRPAVITSMQESRSCYWPLQWAFVILAFKGR